MRAGVATLIPLLVVAQERRILVVTASSGDYIFGAGGTLARYAREGWSVAVAQFGNDDKMSTGRSPAWTRLANVEEGKAASRVLGADVQDVVLMDHPSGELGAVSSSEMRQQLFALIRGRRPRMIFLPDPYVHYQDDGDLRWAGKMAEEAWGYSGADTFANDLRRMGFQPYGAPEVFYYAAWRPYRPGEGGEVDKARFRAVDISETFARKVRAAQLLHTRNRMWTRLRLGVIEDQRVDDYVREFVTELAETIGARHGYRYGEEFNHVGTEQGMPPYVLERARRP